MNEYDPVNGLELYWISEKERYGEPRHSVVKVHRSIPIKLRYVKSSHGLVFEMQPTEEVYEWNIAGIIDPDIVQGLELHIARRRSGITPPLLNETSFRNISRFGDFEQIPDEKTLFRVNLRLHVDRLYDLLHVLWRPSYGHVPKYFLGGVNWDQRLLPQKFNSRATLVVVKLPTS